MAGVASHAAVGVGEIGFVFRSVAPGLAVFLNCFGEARLLAVVRIRGRDGVKDLDHFPLLVLVEHGALVEAIVFPVEAALLPGGTQASEVRASGGSGES